MKKNNKFGFTLLELLAVIVILAVIFVIAVPKVMSVIEDTKKATLESTAKMIASAGEKAKVQNQVLGKDEKLTCESVSKLNDVDYERCDLVFVDNIAYVSIEGKNKFEGLFICKGTKNEAKVVDYCPNEKVLVEIDPSGGTVEDLSGIYKEGDILELLIPTKENSTFISWNVVKGNSVIEENILTVGSSDTIVYALYEAWNTLEVDLDGGIDNIDYDEYYKSGTNIELETPTKENYKFVGWDIVSGNGNVSGSTLTMGSENTVVKALWQLNVFNLTVELNGGSVNKDISGKYAVGTQIELETPTKTGYTFTGWSVNVGSIDNNILTIGNGYTILTANWKASTYTVKYDANGGEGSMADSTFNYGVAVNLPANAFMRTVYTFNGWNTKADGTGTSYADKASVTNLANPGESITLYAQWGIVKPAPGLYQAGSNYTVLLKDWDTLLNEGYIEWNRKDQAQILKEGLEGDLVVHDDVTGWAPRVSNANAHGQIYNIYESCNEFKRITNTEYKYFSNLRSLILTSSMTGLINTTSFGSLAYFTDIYWIGTREQFDALLYGSIDPKIAIHCLGVEASSLSLTDRTDVVLPEGVTTGEAQRISAMPNVASLNTVAEAPTPANTVLYGWRADRRMVRKNFFKKDEKTKCRNLK